jgi:hypothetical protein
MDLEEVEFGVDSLNEAELPRQGVEGANATVVNATDTRRGFVMDVAGGEQRLATATEVGFVEASLDTALAVVKPPS